MIILLLALATGGAQAASTAFVNVNVVPMTEETVLTGRTVIVTDGAIVAVGPVESTVLPEDAVVVDGTDRYLIPGLTEMHAHVPAPNSRDFERIMTLFVANGVTTIRGMLGRPSHLDLRQRILDGEFVAPRLITSGPSLNGNSVDGPEHGREMVREQHAAGYDFLKIHPGLTRSEFDAIAETANELGIPFAGHVPEDVGIARALQVGIATIDHLDGYMVALLPRHEDPSGGFGGFFGVFLADQARGSEIEGVAAATAEAGAWNVPTQSLFEHVVSPTDPDEMAYWPEMQYMPQSTVAQWQDYKEELQAESQYEAATAERAIQLRRRLILALHESGAGLALGSDSPQIFNVPGFALHRELAYLVEAGLSPYEALATGTVNVARFFAEEASRGAIRTGMAADLVMLDADPLADIANSRRVHGVMLRGRWLSRSELDEMLQRYER